MVVSLKWCPQLYFPETQRDLKLLTRVCRFTCLARTSAHQRRASHRGGLCKFQKTREKRGGPWSLWLWCRKGADAKQNQGKHGAWLWTSTPSGVHVGQGPGPEVCAQKKSHRDDQNGEDVEISTTWKNAKWSLWFTRGRKILITDSRFPLGHI